MAKTIEEKAFQHAKSLVEEYIGGEEFKKDVNLLNVTKEITIESVKKYIDSPEFKEKAKNDYQNQIVKMIEDAEKKARKWAIIASLIVIGIIGILVSSEFLKVKEKRISIDEEYINVLKTAQDLNSEVKDLKEEINKLEKTATTTIENTDTSLKDINIRVEKAEEKVAKLEKRIRELP